jgi:hypothetical protein
MLADEITITTCRMPRDGGLARPVHEVTITGPGHLFEIRKIADHGRPGTTVRLHLRAGIRTSCVETLNRLLAIAEFDTVAQHGELRSTWTAGVFEQRPGQDGMATGEIVPSADGHVIWCEHGGGLLVDGLKVNRVTNEPGYKQLGALVNLTGPLAPRLSVDRTTVLDPVSRLVAELLVGAVPDLVAANTLLDEDWLSDRGFDNPTLVDLVADEAPSHRCFPGDRSMVSFPPKPNGLNTIAGHPLDHIFLWRLIANGDVGELVDWVPEIAEAGPVLPPRASDLRILCDMGRSWATAAHLRGPGHILAAAIDLGYSPRSVAARLTELGIDGIDIDRFPTDRFRSYAVEMDLFGKDIGPNDRHVPDRAVSLDDVTAVATKHGIAVSRAMDIMSAYGLAVGPPPKSTSDKLAELTDAVLPDWLASAGAQILAGIDDVRAPIPLGHVLNQAKALDMSVAEIERILRALGLTPPDLPPTVAVEDIRLVSVDLDGKAPWLDIRRPVRLHHLIKAHAALNQSPFWAADRLSQLGFTVQSENLPYYPEYRDLTLLREDEFNDGFLDPERPVPLSRLVALSRQLTSPLNQIVGRLRELGMHLPSPAATIRNALAKVPLAR